MVRLAAFFASERTRPWSLHLASSTRSPLRHCCQGRLTLRLRHTGKETHNADVKPVDLTTKESCAKEEHVLQCMCVVVTQVRRDDGNVQLCSCVVYWRDGSCAGFGLVVFVWDCGPTFASARVFVRAPTSGPSYTQRNFDHTIIPSTAQSPCSHADFSL